MVGPPPPTSPTKKSDTPEAVIRPLLSVINCAGTGREVRCMLVSERRSVRARTKSGWGLTVNSPSVRVGKACVFGRVFAAKGLLRKRFSYSGVVLANGGGQHGCDHCQEGPWRAHGCRWLLRDVDCCDVDATKCITINCQLAQTTLLSD
jgi:hypothetical protein